MGTRDKVERLTHKPTKKRETMETTLTTESHPYRVELLSGNFSVMNIIRTTTEDSALSQAESLNYLLGRQNRHGQYVAVIATKKWNGTEWETLTETEW